MALGLIALIPRRGRITPLLKAKLADPAVLFLLSA